MSLQPHHEIPGEHAEREHDHRQQQRAGTRSSALARGQVRVADGLALMRRLPPMVASASASEASRQ